MSNDVFNIEIEKNFYVSNITPLSKNGFNKILVEYEYKDNVFNK
jgi:hypothetical protein